MESISCLRVSFFDKNVGGFFFFVSFGYHDIELFARKNKTANERDRHCEYNIWS